MCNDITREIGGISVFIYFVFRSLNRGCRGFDYPVNRCKNGIYFRCNSTSIIIIIIII